MGKGGKYPVKAKKNEHGEYEGLQYALTHMQGWRKEMEDKHHISLNLPGFLQTWSCASIFDGHGGAKAVKYASKNLQGKLLKRINQNVVINAGVPAHEEVRERVIQAHLALDKSMRKGKRVDDGSGTTAVTVLISPTHFYFSNLGDSRAVLSRGGKVQFATKDHKPTTKAEKNRIEAAGGYVRHERVEGNLALSRAFGDFEFKSNEDLPPNQQMVIACPDVTIVERNEADDFVVLACDGIFDVMPNSELIKFIGTQLAKTNNLKKICNHVVDICLKKGSRDNMSVAIITFPHRPSLEERQQKRKREFNQMTESLRVKKRRRIDSGLRNPNQDASVLGSLAAPVMQQQNVGPNNNQLNGTAGDGNLRKIRQKQPPSPFILYFLDQWKASNGNICSTAKKCGEKWKRLKPDAKRKYKRRFQYQKKKLNLK